MPPSPSLRCSPGRERRVESTHKRGRSFESGLSLKAKDDDLALFNDMESRERDNFLLHTSDDFEDSISKLKYFSEFKLGITIPVRGENSNLLTVDGEKNDYDWLLTPPDTPLFASLDDDERQPANLLPRGRPRSQPILISRSSMSERTHRSSRSSASPHRLSPSSRSSNGLPLRGRPSSATRSSPPPVLRPTTPSRRPSTPPNKPSTPTPRPSTPPNKPSTPTPRASTPTTRRMSSGSSGQTSSSGKRGLSPVKTSRGNSASPKFRGWQANFDGFSSDAPPNLRTSLSDRPALHTRGLSPSSRNGRDPSTKIGRQSLSPTASRSASSSHSHEKGCLSNYSRGSVVSSGDDDVDSLNSVGISSSLTARKNAVIGNSKAIPFSKKSSRTGSASSVPKTSVDSALRQMEHRRIPQNMFRPLLSSVPTTTFYVGKTNSMHRPVFSRNSSLTTSSNASSEQGASVAPDMEGSDHDQNDLAGEWERTQDPDSQEEIFVFDKVEGTNEGDGHEVCVGEFDASMKNEITSQVLESPMGNLDVAATITSASESSYAAGDHPEDDGYETMATCSRCGKKFHIAEGNANTAVCIECAEKCGLFTPVESGTTLPLTREESVQSEMAIEMDTLCSKVQIGTGVPEMLEKSSSEVMLDQHERNKKHGPDCPPDNCLSQLVFNQREQQHSVQQLDEQQSATQSNSRSQQSLPTVGPSLRVDSPEVKGISVLLQSSSSSKWPFVQGRSLSATNIHCSEPSYARDSCMKRSIGWDSSSASSSVDLGSARHTEDRIRHQLSSKKCEMANAISDSDAKAQIIGLHTEVSVNAYEAAFHTKSESEEISSSFTDEVEYEAFRETGLTTNEHENFSERAKLCDRQSSIREARNGEIFVHADSCLTTSDSHFLSHTEKLHLVDTSLADNLNDEDCTSCVSAEEDLSRNSHTSIRDIEVPDDIPDSSVVEEEYMLNGTYCPNDGYTDAAKSSSAVILELENDHDSFRDIETECMASKNPSYIDAFHEQSVSTTSEKGVLVSASETNIVNHAHEEPTVTVEGPRGHMSRSLTLEEATDSILFCSSIIHDLAYKAVTIGMEKELMLREASRPTVTILGNPVSNQRDSRKMPDRNSPKPQKFRRKRLEIQTKPKELEDDLKVEEPPPSNGEIPNKAVCIKPPKLESKCNCTVM